MISARSTRRAWLISKAPPSPEVSGFLCVKQVVAAFSCGGSGKSVAVGDRELMRRLAPLSNRSAWLGGDVAQCQPDQLGGCLVAGKVPARLGDLAQLAVQAHAGVGRAEQQAYCRRGGEERDDLLLRPDEVIVFQAISAWSW
jgi:hypothetical protein